MDSVGAGALPDAARYGDCGADTLGHIYSRYPDLSLPNLSSLGLSSIEGVTLAPYHGGAVGRQGYDHGTLGALRNQNG